MSSKETGNVNEEAQLLQGQAEVYNQMFGFAKSLALRSAVELGIADIIHSHGQPMSLSHIASKIESPSPGIKCLARVMRMLVRNKIFTVDYDKSSVDQEEEEALLYGLTPTSRWLVHDNEFSLAPVFLTFTHPWMMAPWHKFSASIKEGGTPFEKAYGQTFYERASVDPEFNNMFNTGMACGTKPLVDAILTGYKDGFSKIEGTLVDVGGGTGMVIASVTQAYPHIKGINFDMPHVVATAPKYPGVAHVTGDMFKEIPDANVVLLKSVLANWDDENCLKILKNCQHAVLKNKGKIVIVDFILEPDGKGLFDDTKIAFDLLMMAVSFHGKERTIDEWKKLLKAAGFTCYNFITIAAALSIIEVFPQ